MEDPLIENCEENVEKNGGDGSGTSTAKVLKDTDEEIGRKSDGPEPGLPLRPCKSPRKPKSQHHVVHPISGGALNCMLAVDNVVRATAVLGTPRKISLAPGSPANFDVSTDEEDEALLLMPLQNTRHLFLREYKKPFKWPTQARRKFQILNSSGDCIYFAAERSSFLSKVIFLRGIFPYKINVLSLNGDPVLEIKCQPFFTNCVTITNFRGDLIGKISKVHNWNASLRYSLKTWDGTEILNIVGPDGSNCCMFADCGNDDFEVNLGSGKTSIGKISAEWEYSLEDVCGVFVPIRLDELSQSLLLGAVFLIDFNFYQRKRDASCFGRCFLTFSFFALFILLLFLIAKK